MDVAYLSLVAVFISLLLIINNFAVIRWVYSWITWCSNIIRLHSLPSPPRRWLLGHALEIDMTQKSLMYMQENHRKYPKLCVYWLGPFIPWVFTGDVETMKMFLCQPGEYPKPPMYGFLRKWVGEGLILSSGAKWKSHRKMLTPAFHFDILKQYVPVYNEVSHKLLEIWSPLADTGEAVDVTQYTKACTMEVLLKYMFSKSSDCLENKDSLHLVAMDELLSLFVERSFTPQYAFDWIYFSTATGRKFLHYCEIVHKFSNDVIMERRKELLEGVHNLQPAKKYRDFIDILLSMKDDNGQGLTDTEIREEVDTFMTGGHDTTAVALGWCLYCMAMYKEHQEICRKEIREILTGRNSANIIWEDLSKLNYVTLCIKETLRLYPLLPFVGKLSSEDVVVNGYRIPKGTWIGIGCYAMHHDPLVWNNPEKFDPMRFATENLKNMDSFTFLAFSAGPRNCIGQRFALHELKVILANILNRFNLDLDATHKIEPHCAGMYRSKTGIKLKLYSAE